ncbi:MAG: hypothetical protein AAF787_06655 [Chloroflexota bacterium]
MCVFCAAVPATVALGAAAKAKQNAAAHTDSDVAETTDATSLPDWMLALPAERVTALVIVGLVAGSVVYHSQISPV